MVNKKVLERFQKNITQRNEEQERAKSVLYKNLKPYLFADEEKIVRTKSGKTKKIRPREPINMTVLAPLEWHLPAWIHDWKGQQSLKTWPLCDVFNYNQKQCDICETEGKYGLCKPKPCWCLLVYCHNFEGRTFRKQDGTLVEWNPIRVFAFPQGGTKEVHWGTLKMLDGQEMLHKTVIQIFHKKGSGMTITPLSKEQKLALPNQGKVPKEVRTLIKGYSFDEMLAHELNAYGNADFSYYGVEEPEPPAADDDEDTGAGSYEDEDGTEEEAAEDDFDEDETSKPGKGKKAKRITSEDDDDDDESSKSDSDSEDDE